MRRSTVFIAVGGALMVAAVIVTVGVTLGAGDAGSPAVADTATQVSPSPSRASTEGKTGSATPAAIADQLKQNIRRLRQALEEDPHDVDVLLTLGTTYYLGQRFKQATRTFEQALREDPKSATAQTRLAMVWHAQGDSKRARQTLAAIIAANPRHQEAHYSLAIIYFSRGRVDDAKVQWREAARIDPKSTVGRRSQSFIDLLGESESAAGATAD